jgi:hypothetical protein
MKMRVLMSNHSIKSDAPEDVLRIANNFSISHIVKRYMKDFDLHESVALKHFDELKHFLVLGVFGPGIRYGMRGQVDDAWHTFLIYTREYADFCDQIAGRFIHHVPEKDSDGQDADAIKESRESYERTLVDYEKLFGRTPSEEIWPRLGQGSTSGNSACGTSCSGCGSGCSSCGHGCRGCNACNIG